jgi:hypothetical protein
MITPKVSGIATWGGSVWLSFKISGFALLVAAYSFSAVGDPLDTWTVATTEFRQNLYGVAYGDGRYVAVGSGLILTSTNGAFWQQAASPNNSLFGVSFANGTFVAVGAGGLILKSTNTGNWVAQPSPTTNQLNHVEYYGSFFLAGGNTGTLLVSSNGTIWTLGPPATSRALVGSASGNDVFVAVARGQSNPGTLLTSSNALDWVARSFSGLGFPYGIAFGKGLFVMLDARGLVNTSPDGIQWATRSTVTSDYLFGITFAQHTFAAVGGPYGGGSQKIATSLDGLNWRLRPISTGRSGALRAVTYGNGYFIAVGDGGLILRSGPVSTLRVIAVDEGTASLVLDGEIGRSYRIETTSSLSGSNWADLVTITNTTEATPVFDDQAEISPMRFYRAITP